MGAPVPGFDSLLPARPWTKLPFVVAFYVFLLIVAAVGAAAYLFLFFTHIPGAADERLGRLEPLPSDLNQWVRQQEPSPDGLVVERRSLLAEGSQVKIVEQIRYRDPQSGEIVRVDPELTHRRRRRKPE